MCDILVATPRATEKGIMIFAKNSDREPNEAQILEFIPRMKHEDEKVKLTYVEFSQVRETYAVLLSRPWWMWGAEMGANEFGLAMGNTAVFTKLKVSQRGITGMDIIRLALERTKTSREALEFIVSLIENYGQGGNGSYRHKLFYHNSFIIADPREAWVLETAGRHWVAKKVNAVYSISNALTIEDEWDLASDSVERLSKKANFSFARYFSDKFYTHFAHGRERRAFTYKKLREAEGEITLEYMMEILRSHQREPFEPANGSMKDICMHYGGLTRPSQTASSQISELRKSLSTHWFTGTSLPCLSIFKPMFFDGTFPDLGEAPTDKYNPKSYWWRFEAFHRRFQTNYRTYFHEFSKDRDAIQARIIERERELRDKKSKELTLWAFEEERKLMEKWEGIIEEGKLPFLYGRNWKKVNEEAGVQK
ncbi:peptidase U34 [Thermococci archaeon]|nr:MAG: peptidase U34 [Thermococci archaeon]